MRCARDLVCVMEVARCGGFCYSIYVWVNIVRSTVSCYVSRKLYVHIYLSFIYIYIFIYLFIYTVCNTIQNVVSIVIVGSLIYSICNIGLFVTYDYKRQTMLLSI